MKEYRLNNFRVKMLVRDEDYYVPIKLFFMDRNLNFNMTMMYFNNFNIDFQKYYEDIDGESHLCFEISDFIAFIFIINLVEPKLKKFASKLSKSILNSSFNIINKMEFNPYDILEKYVRIPLADEKSEFITSSKLFALMDKEDKKHFGPTSIGVYLSKMGFVRRARRINDSPRYGYDMVFLKQVYISYDK